MQCIVEGNISIISLSNVGDLNEFDFNIDDINEEADINSIFEQVDSYYESMELDLSSDGIKYKVINPEDIEHIYIDNDEMSLDDVILIHKNIKPIKELLENANVGDLIYLRKEQGKGSIRYDLASKGQIGFEYFDCLEELDQSDLLSNSYYDIICDSIDLDNLKCNDNKVDVDSFDFEPQIVYGEFYKVIYDNQRDEKVLVKLKIPGFYFLDKTTNTDEVLKI